MSTRDQSNSARLIAEAEKLVMGKRSSAWAKWWDEYGQDTAQLYTSCMAALLSVSAPPAAQFITTDIANAIRFMPKKSDADYTVKLAAYERAQRAQWAWNRQFNQWAIDNHMHGNNKGHGPAQFRKFFAAWLMVIQ